jgi:hypothetical protein
VAHGLFEQRPKEDVTCRHFKSATAGNGLALGQNLVTASYSGDANFQASSGSVNLQVYNQALPLSLSPQSAAVRPVARGSR